MRLSKNTVNILIVEVEAPHKDRALSHLPRIVGSVGTEHCKRIEIRPSGFGLGGTVTDFQKLFEMNVLAAATTINLALPHLRDGGRIVAISSAVSLTRPAGLAAYAASKAALNAYIETLAKELKDRHITANALLPTTLDSSSAPKSAERLVKRENVAEMVALLLSEQGSNITGQLIGMSA